VTGHTTISFQQHLEDPLRRLEVATQKGSVTPPGACPPLVGGVPAEKGLTVRRDSTGRGRLGEAPNFLRVGRRCNAMEPSSS
jgi:hypothetical protein